MTLTTLKPGDQVLFNHFGGTDRPGRVVKVTKSKVYIEWTSPASGITRVVPLGLTPITFGGREYPPQIAGKNVRIQEAR